MITLLAMPADRAKAETIVDAMVAADLDVWNETATPGGADWSEALVRTQDTRCLVICWSEAALADTVEARLFRDAALNACRQGRAIGALLGKVEPPEGFRCTLYNLAGWRLNPVGWRKLLIGDAFQRDIVQAARFKQANRDPAPPSAPRQLFLRQAAVLSSAIIVPLVGVASFTDVLLNFERRMAATPSSAEVAAWEALPSGDCAALRQFVRDFKQGAYRDKANALLSAVEKVERVEWRVISLDEEIYLPHAAGTRVSDAIAEGQRRCEMLLQGTEARDLSVEVSQLRQSCEDVGGTKQCDWRGKATCSFEEPDTTITEVCNP